MRLFVISDLHLGGRPHAMGFDAQPGSQICTSYPELVDFIDWISALEDEAVELVVNGDIVDFLMEDDYGYRDLAVPWLSVENEVLAKLKIIIKRTRREDGRSPFDAMAELLARGRSITFMLGNHDVELSLPAVRRYLEDEVLKVGVHGRFRFIYDGEAYVLGDLLIEHGNRYDPWNIINHSALRQERSMLSRGWGEAMRARPSGQFVPPPGSFMVTQVINQLKHHYRFVDLLKPENHTVVPILLAIHPNLKHALAATLYFFDQSNNEFVGVGEPLQSGQLSAGGIVGAFDLEASLSLALDKELATRFDVSTGAEGQLGVADAWEKLKRLSANIANYIKDGRSLFAEEASEQVSKARNELLRIALASWRGKLALNTTHEAPEYLLAAKKLAEQGSFTCIVFGHTHLPKEIAFTAGGHEAKYINTGTWTDVMQIPQRLLEPGMAASNEFHHFINDLRENRVDQYLVSKLSYADILVENNCTVEAKLCQYCPDKDGA